MLDEDEWFPLSASGGRYGGCDSSSDTRLGAGGGEGSADGSRQEGLAGANRQEGLAGANRQEGLAGANRGLGMLAAPTLPQELLTVSTGDADGAALVVVGVLTTGDGALVTAAGVTGAAAAVAGCCCGVGGGCWCSTGGCQEGPLWSSGAGDGGPRRARGGLERALGTHGGAAAELVVVAVVGVQLAVVTAVGAAAAPTGGVVVVAHDAGLAAAWLGACGGLG